MKIALYRGTSTISKAIEWQTRGVYSHASLILPDGSVIESKEGHGVRHLPAIEKDAGEMVDIFEVPTTPEQEQGIIAFAMAQVGKPYDYEGIAAFLSRKELPDTEDCWFCSGLVFGVFRKAGIALLSRIIPRKVCPNVLSFSPLPKECIPVVTYSALKPLNNP